jgi:membrane-bound lytic murein transglycosylase A
VIRLLSAVAALAMLSACASIVPTPGAEHAPPRIGERPAPPVAQIPPPTTGKPANALASGVKAGPPIETLAIPAGAAGAALTAFRLSCPALQKRSDASGLTQSADWSTVCASAANWPDGDAVRFFATQLVAVQVGTGQAFTTGYYEPEISGSRTPQPGYDTPVYRRPPDLVEGDLGDFYTDLKGRKIRGRVQDGKLLPYPDRGAIEDGALKSKNLEIAWAADPIEFFFLQVQGSGRLKLPDGSVMRIGYDGQNGGQYVGIGALMRDRGLLGPGELSMQGVMAWLRAHPAEGDAIMRENKSFVFFRELRGTGPIGALGVAVAGRVTVAADPAFVPLGAPVVLSLDRPEASGLWIAQDTGGAIKGPNRFDTFWGAGDEARRIAGGMSGRGQAWLLLPKAAAARLGTADGGSSIRS